MRRTYLQNFESGDNCDAAGGNTTAESWSTPPLGPRQYGVTLNGRLSYRNLPIWTFRDPGWRGWLAGLASQHGSHLAVGGTGTGRGIRGDGPRPFSDIAPAGFFILHRMAVTIEDLDQYFEAATGHRCRRFRHAVISRFVPASGESGFADGSAGQPVVDRPTGVGRSHLRITGGGRSAPQG